MSSQHRPVRSPEAIRDQLRSKLDGLVEATVDELYDFAEVTTSPRAQVREAVDAPRADPNESLTLEPDEYDDDDDGALSRYQSVEYSHLDSGDEELDDETYEGVKTAIERSSQQNSPVSPSQAAGEAAFHAAKAKGEAEAKHKIQLRRQQAAALKTWDHSPKAGSPTGGGGPAAAGRSVREARRSEAPKSVWAERGPTPGQRICVVDKESPHVHRFGQVVEHRTRVVTSDATHGNREESTGRRSPPRTKRVGTVSIRLEDRTGQILRGDTPFVVQLSAIVPAEAAEIQSTFRRPKPGQKSPSTAPAQERHGLAQLNRVIKALRKKTGATNLPLMTDQDFSELLQPDSSVRELLFRDFTEWYVDKVKKILEEDRKKNTSDSFNLARDISASMLAEALRAVRLADREKQEQELARTRAADRERKDREAQERREQQPRFVQLEEETKRLRKELASKTSREELSKKYRYRDAEARRELHRREREDAMSPGSGTSPRGIRHTMKTGAMQASVVQSWAGMAGKPDAALGGAEVGAAAQGTVSPSARWPSASTAKNRGLNGVAISFEYDEKYIAAHEDRATLVARQEQGRLYELADLNRVIKALRKKTGAGNLPLMTDQAFSKLLRPDSSVRRLLFRDFTEWYVDELQKTGGSYNLVRDVTAGMVVDALRAVRLADPDFGDSSSKNRDQKPRPKRSSSPGQEPEPEPEPTVRVRPAQWTVEQVVAWLTEIGLGEYGPQFRQQEMEGTALKRLCMLLNQDSGASGNAKTQAVWRQQVEEACGLNKLGHFLVFWSELSRLDF
jgi:hypothetical protein